MGEIALFSSNIYTAGTNLTRPLVVTVATNIDSAYLQWKVEYYSAIIKMRKIEPQLLSNYQK